MKNRRNNFYVVNIGNELLNGKALNTNLAYLGKRLQEFGFEIKKAFIIPDNSATIQKTLRKIWKEHSVVFITGGLGPTRDDITRMSVAEFFQRELEYNEFIYENIKQKFEAKNIKMPEINKIQAFFPKGFDILYNHLGTAHGLYFSEGKKHLFCLPGVPFELEYIFKHSIIAYLKQWNRFITYDYVDIHTFGISESKAAEMLDQQVLEKGVNIAWLPQIGRVDIRLFGNNIRGVHKALKEVCDTLRENIWGINEVSPANALHDELLQSKRNIYNLNIFPALQNNNKNRKLTLSVVESCTGGMLSSALTKIPGSSKYFIGALVAYANDVKSNLLDISPDILKKQGAVSKKTLIAMLNGCEKLFNTDIVCAISGVAGPEGGTKKKPVGTVYIGVKLLGNIFVERCFFDGNRERIRHKAFEKTIFMILKMIQSLDKKDNIIY